MAFDESQHPRDEKGKFEDAGGSSSKADAKSRDPTKTGRKFTEQQQIELKDYAEGNYTVLNGYLRNPGSVDPSLAKELDKQVKSIDQAIAKSTLTKDVTVYRGIDHPTLAAKAEQLIGKTADSPSFMSTSLDSRSAADFAGFSKGGVVLAIKAPAGTNAIDMEPFKGSGNAGEREILFGRGSKFKITGVDRSGRLPVVHGEFV